VVASARVARQAATTREAQDPPSRCNRDRFRFAQPARAAPLINRLDNINNQPPREFLIAAYSDYHISPVREQKKIDHNPKKMVFACRIDPAIGRWRTICTCNWT
jgi:hypothetical protein